MASITSLQKRVQNVLNRQAQTFLRTESIDTSGSGNAIADVDTSQDYFQVNDVDLSGDSEFAAGNKIYVDGSTANDAAFTIESVSTGDFDNEGDGTDSRVNVSESIKDSTADGTIYTDKTYEYVNVGRVQESSFTAEPITSEQDQDGRTSTQLFDVTLSFTLMQTGTEEQESVPAFTRPDVGGNTDLYPRGHELYSSGHFMYFSGTSTVSTATVNAAVANDAEDAKDGELQTDDTNFDLAEDVNGLVFQNILLNASPELNFSGDQSIIPLESMARLRPNEWDDVDTTRRLAFAASPEFDYA